MTHNNFVFICRDKMSYLELTEKRKELASFVILDNCYKDMDNPLVKREKKLQVLKMYGKLRETF